MCHDRCPYQVSRQSNNAFSRYHLETQISIYGHSAQANVWGATKIDRDLPCAMTDRDYQVSRQSDNAFSRYHLETQISIYGHSAQANVGGATKIDRGVPCAMTDVPIKFQDNPTMHSQDIIWNPKFP